MIKKGFGLSFCIVILFFLVGCVPHTIKQKQLALGTYIEITIADRNLTNTQKLSACKDAFLKIKHIEKLLSLYLPESDITKINASAAKEAVLVDDLTLKLIKKSCDFSQRTEGAFDVTAYPLLKLWGCYNSELKHIPEDKDIKEILRLVGWKKIKINTAQKKIFLQESEMGIDLAAIAKGFAVDEAMKILKARNVKNALINAGGDIYCLGEGLNGNGWKVGIQHPRISGKILRTLRISDKAVATSGDYQKYSIIENKRISHIIDPRDGKSVVNLPASVTVISADCTSADALATAIFVLGPTRGMHLVETLDDTEAIIVSAKGGGVLGVASSSGLKKEDLSE